MVLPHRLAHQAERLPSANGIGHTVYSFTQPMGFWKITPFMTGKCFFRSRISTKVSLIVAPRASNG